jgi:hypothetical protein
MYDEAVQPVCTTKDLGVDSVMFEPNSRASLTGNLVESYSVQIRLTLTPLNIRKTQ